MSRSLNSDYLDQLLIKADTSRLDGDLVRLAAEERPVPEEEQALLVFKRGSATQFHPSSLPAVCMFTGTHETAGFSRPLRRSAALRQKEAGSAALQEMTCPVNPCAQAPIAQHSGSHQRRIKQLLSQCMTAGWCILYLKAVRSSHNHGLRIASWITGMGRQGGRVACLLQNWTTCSSSSSRDRSPASARRRSSCGTASRPE